MKYRGRISFFGLQDGPALVFFGSCLVFLIIRVLVVCGSVDRLHNVDEGEYRLAAMALNRLGGAYSIEQFKHLWAQEPFAFLLIPFLVLGVGTTTSLKIAAILFSLVGFAAVLYSILKKLGVVYALVFAVPMIFPEQSPLAWTLTYWGCHPEAASLIMLGVPILIFASDTKRPFLYLLAGLWFGLILNFSLTVAFIVLAASVTPAAENSASSVLKKMLLIVAGVAIGAIPFLLWYFRNKTEGVLETTLFSNPGITQYKDLFAFPDTASLHQLKNALAIHRFFENTWIRVLAGVSVLWTAVRSLMPRPSPLKGWGLLFPVTVLLGGLMILTVRFVAAVGIRHYLWLYTAIYFCISVFLGDLAVFFISRIRTIPGKVGLAVVGLFTALFSFWQVMQVAPLIRIRELHRLGEFHGLEYSCAGIGMVIGDAIPNVNCLLKEKPELLMYKGDIKNIAFLNGVQYLFGVGGFYTCCLSEDPNHADMLNDLAVKRLPEPPLDKDYLKGFGCACALKPVYGLKPMPALREKYGDEALQAVLEGYRLCSELPCVRAERIEADAPLSTLFPINP